jgi:hypothetical protein
MGWKWQEIVADCRLCAQLCRAINSSCLTLRCVNNLMAEPRQTPGLNQASEELWQAMRICAGTYMPVDVERFTAHLRNEAQPRSVAKCALYVRLALAAGGAQTHGGHPQDAKNWGPMLLRIGFRRLNVENSDSFLPMKGDIVVIQPYQGGNASGHIAAFDGKIWISDFKQHDFWSGQGYRTNRPAHAFYRP